jgi:serine/threonine-protein kinase
VFVSLLVLLTFYMGWADVMEYKLYDMRAKLRARAKAGDAVVMIGIDDQSIREIGRWPWPRNYLAEMTDQLAEAGAKVIGIDVFLREPELNPGLQQIKTMQAAFSEKLDSIALATNVVLPMYFELGVPIGKVDKPVPDFVAKSFIANTVEVHRA